MDQTQQGSVGAFVSAALVAAAVFATTAVLATAVSVVVRLLFWDSKTGAPVIVIGAVLQLGGLVSAVAHLEASGETETEPARRRARAAMAGIIVAAYVAFPLELVLLYR